MLIRAYSRVNPVEHIYAAFPTFLYLNASIGGALLQPLLESQAGLTDQPFAAQDIGATYPAASGPSVVSKIAVEREFPSHLELRDWPLILCFFRNWEHAHHGIGTRKNIG